MQTITQDAELVATSKGKKTVVMVHATWCPFCVRFKPTFVQETAQLRGWEALECLIDDEANPIWNKHRINVVPTILFLEDGKVTARLDGTLGRGLRADQLAKALKNAGAVA